jgi:acetylornithine deacetylase/succinyl-diaminopimelate desuccinylase-like protein
MGGGVGVQMDQDKLARGLEESWRSDVLPRLVDYIRIPNKSPAFDPDWSAHGHMEAAVTLLSRWAESKLDRLPGARLEVLRLAQRTPVILIDIPATAGGPGGAADRQPVLLYGHLDKQPEMTGWTHGRGPWTPVIEGDKLYGRGGADDGYSLFAALGALLALAEQGVQRARCVILIEACEESGSYDLPFYVDHLADRLGDPSLVICLDSGCGNYDQLWVTTSLRGMLALTLAVRVLSEGVHSGDASGVVPSSFRILRQLISRLEDEATGAIRPADLYVQVPADRIAEARTAAAALGSAVHAQFPLLPGMSPVSSDPVELMLNRTWRPQLATIGMAGLPLPGDAGNVLRPETRARLSLRLPPTLDAEKASATVSRLLQSDPPYGAAIHLEDRRATTGWNAPSLAPWLARSLDGASRAAFGRPPAYMGEGGSIPFMTMLGEKFPAAQFVVTGVLGPHANAHGPNEFLHLPTARRVTEAVARVVADHARRPDPR